MNPCIPKCMYYTPETDTYRALRIRVMFSRQSSQILNDLGPRTILLESITARTKRDHWVPGLPRHRWYTVHQQIHNPHTEYMMPPKYKELDFNSITTNSLATGVCYPQSFPVESIYHTHREFGSNYRTVANFTYIIFNALIKASGLEGNASLVMLELCILTISSVILILFITYTYR